MSAALLQSTLPDSTWKDNDAKFDDLCQFVNLGQGRFSLALVEFDLPSLQAATLARLRDQFKDRKIVTIELTPPPPDVPRAYDIFDQMAEQLKFRAPDGAPDALVIIGLEKLYPAAAAGRDNATEQLARVIQPLNLGRNQFNRLIPAP